jgi:hypothetical protein
MGKLINAGVNGKVLKVVMNMYANAKSCLLSMTNAQKVFFQSNLGVRKGENLLPVLFALFLNDMKH